MTVEEAVSRGLLFQDPPWTSRSLAFHPPHSYPSGAVALGKSWILGNKYPGSSLLPSSHWSHSRARIQSTQGVEGTVPAGQLVGAEDGFAGAPEDIRHMEGSFQNVLG